MIVRVVDLILGQDMSRSSVVVTLFSLFGAILMAMVLSGEALRGFIKNNIGHRPETVAVAIGMSILVGIVFVKLVSSNRNDVGNGAENGDENGETSPSRPVHAVRIRKERIKMIRQRVEMRDSVDWDIFYHNVENLRDENVRIDFREDDWEDMEKSGPDFEKLRMRIDRTTLDGLETDRNESIVVDKWIDEKQELTRHHGDKIKKEVDDKFSELFSS